MRSTAALLVMLALGCGQPAGPKLRFVDLGADESANPMTFALKFANDGDDDTLVDEIVGNTTSETIGAAAAHARTIAAYH